MKVVCVKWGTRYSDLWVLRLRAMVEKRLNIPFQFECFTDREVSGVTCRPLTSGLTGWWPKLELFKPGTFDGQVLYLDLDLVLTSSINRVVEVAGTDLSKVWMRDDFSYSLRNPRKDIGSDMRRTLGGVGTCNSSVMCWHGDAGRKVWDSFTQEAVKDLHGDQNHISRTLFPDGIGFLPDEMVGSYKYGKIRSEPMAPIMVFHGNPKMDELPKSDPLRREWEAA